MIKFNVPYTSRNQAEHFNELIKNKRYAGDGDFNKKVKDILFEKYNFQNTFLTTSCTSSILLCAMAIRFDKDDEIIIPSYTFASTPSPFLMQGAKIVFADSGNHYPNITLESIKKVVTKNTKAVMVVHYGGFNDEIEAIQEYCKTNNLILIEDAAQAINSYFNGKPLGSFGDFSVFSFHETKNINCGEGGLLVVNNNQYLDIVDQIYECGTNKSDFKKGIVSKYEWASIGLSFTLSEINCSFLYPQLLEIDKVTEKRKGIWNNYYNELKSLESKRLISLPNINLQNSNAHTFYIVLNNRAAVNKLSEFMSENGIQCTTHYQPLHSSKFGAKNISSKTKMTNADNFGAHLFRLPLHYNLTNTELEKITSLIHLFFENR